MIIYVLTYHMIGYGSSKRYLLCFKSQPNTDSIKLEIFGLFMAILESKIDFRKQQICNDAWPQYALPNVKLVCFYKIIVPKTMRTYFTTKVMRRLPGHFICREFPYRRHYCKVEMLWQITFVAILFLEAELIYVSALAATKSKHPRPHTKPFRFRRPPNVGILAPWTHGYVKYPRGMRKSWSTVVGLGFYDYINTAKPWLTAYFLSRLPKRPDADAIA